MIKPGLNIYKGIEEITEDFCNHCAKIPLNQNYSIVLSGGNTPKAIFEIISTQFKDFVNWKNFEYYWGDERCVGPDHQDSNYKMAYDYFLKPVGISSSSIHRIRGEVDPMFEADRYTVEILKNVKNKNGFASFDLIILGLGDDGHTASIFPDQHNLFKSTRVCDTSVHPVTGQKRITLTFETINHADQVFFLVTGKKKSKIVNEIINKKGNWNNYPASMVQPEAGSLSWLLDSEAASEL